MTTMYFRFYQGLSKAFPTKIRRTEVLIFFSVVVGNYNFRIKNSDIKFATHIALNDIERIKQETDN